MSLINYVCRPCIVCHKAGVVKVDDQEILAWMQGAHIQDALSNSAEEREMIISGTHPACFTELFGSEEM